ncbi:MAG TPA: SAM-dependent methyltransferase [Dehalococcoidia bacterium]|nr:SAM-dependent methyltransferase [Dehalococcoidia bacterium]
MTTEFEPATENAALKEVIRTAIKEAGGAISFCDFMALALYHPAHGYYMSSREKMGRSGDYLTSPEVSPLFAAIVGRQLREMWQNLGCPSRFDVIEAGPGTGLLARDIISWARRTESGFAAALWYTLVESSSALAERQRAFITGEGLAAEIASELPADIRGCILSNELLDAMPVHRVAVVNSALREIYVQADGDHFLEILHDPHPSVEAYFAALDVIPGEGCRAEVNLEAPRWMAHAAGAIERGYVLTFDYGHEASVLYAPWRRDGTLLCFYRHNPSTDPYARVGRQDMTAHVDFTTVRRAGEDAGLTTVGLTTQSQFLEALGITEALALPTADRPDMEEYFARRSAVTELLDPGGLGRIKVLAQSRDVAGPLNGLAAGA